MSSHSASPHTTWLSRSWLYSCSLYTRSSYKSADCKAIFKILIFSSVDKFSMTFINYLHSFLFVLLRQLFEVMVEFNTEILQFEEKGEKTGWTYIEVPAGIAGQLKPGMRKSFRVKGLLDGFAIEGI